MKVVIFFKNILKIFLIYKKQSINFLIITINPNLLITKNEPKIFYGGARKGDLGGPLVKIKKLTKFFPEKKYGFNLVYLLSNNHFLSENSLKLLKKKKLPIILNQNGVFYPGWFKGNYQRKNLNNSKLYHLADYVIWQSEFCKKASEKFLGERKGEGRILYNPVDTNIFFPKFDVSRSNFTFLITGNIRKENNYRINSVFDAFKEILKNNNKIHLNIAGFLEDKDFLLAKAAKLKIMDSITFIGKFTQKEAPHIYQNADAYITLTFQDNCPSAVLEAMSSGLPIIYSNSGGIPELVDKNSGIGLPVYENWDSIEIPEKNDLIRSIFEIMDRKKEMSEAARTRATNLFNLKKWVKIHKEIFEKLL